jgi:hypothetical protein
VEPMPEKGFIPVSQLKPGMHVLEADGNYGTVATLVVVPGAMWMYNLTVAQDHTYTVGIAHWVVHNNDCTDLSESGIKKTLSEKGANITDTTDGLSYNDNRVHLGHYGGNGTIINGIDYPGSMPGQSLLETFTEDYGGKILTDLPGTIEAMSLLSRMLVRSFSTLVAMELPQDH